MLFATPLERESRKWACGRESAPIDARRGGQTLENRSIWTCKNNGFSTTTKSLHTCSSESVGNIPQNTFATPLERESKKWPIWGRWPVFGTRLVQVACIWHWVACIWHSPLHRNPSCRASRWPVFGTRLAPGGLYLALGGLTVALGP